MSIPCTEYKYILPSYSKYELESGHSTDTKRINYHFVASPSKLELAIFLAQLRIIDISTKNAAKRSWQHAGKKYREYAQRRVCFVNKQVLCPTPI